MSYHLKVFCNSNYGGRHAHRTISSHEQGVLNYWKSIFFTAQPLVTNIAAPHWALGGGSLGNNKLSTRSRRSQGTRGTPGRDTKTWHTMPPPTTSDTPDPNIEFINLKVGSYLSKRSSTPDYGLSPPKSQKIAYPSTSMKRVARTATRGITKYKIKNFS